MRVQSIRKLFLACGASLLVLIGVAVFASRTTNENGSDFYAAPVIGPALQDLHAVGEPVRYFYDRWRGIVGVRGRVSQNAFIIWADSHQIVLFERENVRGINGFGDPETAKIALTAIDRLPRSNRTMQIIFLPHFLRNGEEDYGMLYLYVRL